MSQNKQHAAKAGYEAYCKHTNNKSVATGDDLPTWDQLPDGVKNAWYAAAGGMIKFLDSGVDRRIEKIFQKAIASWGISSQMMMAQEECGELIACISQFRRGRKSKDQLAEEIADVEIMCSQLRIMIGNDIVDCEKQKKLERLEHTIAQTQR